MHFIEAAVLGYTCLSYLIFALALVKSAALVPVILATIIAFVVFLLAARTYPAPLRWQPEKKDRTLLVAGVVLYLVAFIHVLWIPPYAIDDLAYHLLVPQQIARTGEFYFSPYNINSNMPMLFEYPLTLGFLTGIPPFTFNLLAGGALLGVIYTAGRQYFHIGRRPLCFAVILLATMPTTYTLLHSGYVEMFLALCLTLAFCHYYKFQEDRGQAWHWYAAAAFLGLAAAVKYSAGFFLLLVFGFEFLRKKDTRAYYAGALLAILCFIPWYLKNFLLLGNPTFPLLYAFFDSQQLSLARAHYYQSMFTGYHYGRTVTDYLLVPFRVLLGWQEAPVPGRLGFDGQLSLFAGLGILGMGYKNERKLFVTLVGVGFFLIWMFYSQQVRFLLAIIPFTLLAGLAFLEGQKQIYRGLMYLVFAAAFAQNAFNLTQLIKGERITALISGEMSRDEFLDLHLPHSYQFAKTTNQLLDPAKHRLFVIGNFDRAYYFDAPVVANTYYDAEVLDLTFRAENPERMRLQDFLEAERITHILINWNFYLSTQSPGAVDLEAVRAFFRDHAEVIAAAGDYQLFQLTRPAM